MPFSELKGFFTENNFDKMLKNTFEIDSVKTAYLDILQKRLYADGEDSKGTKLITNSAIKSKNKGSGKTYGGVNRVYAPFTNRIKRSKGHPFNRVTLIDTGEFYNSFIVKVLNKAILVKANYNKTKGNIYDNFSHLYKTFAEFDEGVTGLQEDEWLSFIDNVYFPNFTMILKNELGRV